MSEDDIFPVVLVVDDERVQLTIITSYLQKAGFRCVTAESANSAIAALDAAGDAVKGITLLVTDLEMPGLSGRDLAADMRRRHPGIKVLYVTANPAGLFGQRHGLDDHEAFLVKPVTQAALREAVNMLLRR